MAQTYVLIASSTVGAGGSASITFSSIPSTYKDLILKVSARNDDSGPAGNILLTFNGVGTGYGNIYLQGNGSGSAATTGTVGQMIGDMDTNGESANTFNNIEVYIPSYASTTMFKAFNSDSVQENNASGAYAMFTANTWSNASAISSIVLTNRTGGRNFVQYTSAYLYGLTNS